MIIVPLGPEEAVVRRHPVVCYAIVAVNVMVFLAFAGFDEEEWSGRLKEQWGELLVFVQEHPDLQVPDSLEEIPPLARLVEETREEAPEVRERPEALRKLEQVRLDTMAEEMRATWRERPATRLGFVPSRPRLLTLLTSMFMHGGLGHLLGNMLFFYVAGPLLEDLYGRPLFLGLYLLSGAAGTGLHFLKLQDSFVPVVGASGAIAGLMGAFLVRLAATRIRFLFVAWFWFRLIRFTFAIPAWAVIPFWFFQDFVVTSSTGALGHSGVAHAAHVGGFILGAFAAFLIKIFAIESRWVHPAIEAETTLVRHPAFLAAVEARAREDWLEARTRIEEALADDPEEPDALMESYLIGLGEGDPAAARAAASRLLSVYEGAGEEELARALREDCEAKLPASPSPEAAGAAGPMELFREGEALRMRGDRQGAQAAFRRALAHPACNDSWRERLEGAVASLQRESELEQ